MKIRKNPHRIFFIIPKPDERSLLLSSGFFSSFFSSFCSCFPYVFLFPSFSLLAGKKTRRNDLQRARKRKSPWDGFFPVAKGGKTKNRDLQCRECMTVEREGPIRKEEQFSGCFSFLFSRGQARSGMRRHPDSNSDLRCVRR